MSGEPEFMICVECECPSYVFEWKEGKVQECLCEVCGNDEVDLFLTQQDYEDLVES